MSRALVSGVTSAGIENASWIRRMFEAGAELKARVGASNVFDYSLGNPDIEPPVEAQRLMAQFVAESAAGSHRYMHNAGFADVRTKIAGYLTSTHNLTTTPLTANHVVMTVGAGGALNVIFETVLDQGDEVITPSPYFAEYDFYVDRHRGKLVPVPTTADFQLDLAAIEAAITPRTKAVLINSPNNPTGAVYSAESLRGLAEILRRKEQEFGHKILLVSDEPYAGLVYDEVTVSPTLGIFPNSLLVTSHSKDLALAGERIGYIGINPRIEEAQALFNGLVFCNRILGFVNAPALWQRVVAELQGVVAGRDEYRARRDLLYDILVQAGYEVQKPQGAFYMFPKSPIPDDVAFAQAAIAHNLLVVPGTGFGRAGYFRLSYSSISLSDIKRSRAAFAAALAIAKSGPGLG